jgi:hypothetical protein
VGEGGGGGVQRCDMRGCTEFASTLCETCGHLFFCDAHCIMFHERGNFSHVLRTWHDGSRFEPTVLLRTCALRDDGHLPCGCTHIASPSWSAAATAATVPNQSSLPHTQAAVPAVPSQSSSESQSESSTPMRVPIPTFEIEVVSISNGNFVVASVEYCGVHDHRPFFLADYGLFPLNPSTLSQCVSLEDMRLIAEVRRSFRIEKREEGNENGLRCVPFACCLNQFGFISANLISNSCHELESDAVNNEPQAQSQCPSLSLDAIRKFVFHLQRNIRPDVQGSRIDLSKNYMTAAVIGACGASLRVCACVSGSALSWSRLHGVHGVDSSCVVVLLLWLTCWGSVYETAFNLRMNQERKLHPICMPLHPVTTCPICLERYVF